LGLLFQLAKCGFVEWAFSHPPQEKPRTLLNPL
jgi:hypothetical protein